MMKFIDAVIHGHPVKISFDENSIHVYNAFQIKDDLKLRGYRFDPGDKSWYIKPSDIDRELETLRGKSPGQAGEKKLLIPAEKDSSGGGELPDSLTVLDLRNRIDMALNNAVPGRIWLRGVIASEVKNYKWFSYFDLKDEDENIDLHFNVESKSSNIERITEKLKLEGISEKLEKDLPVFVEARVKVSAKAKVDVRVEVLDILPEYTRAKIRSKLDLTVEKLKVEKLFHLQKELPLPPIVRDIAVITSEQGTSVRDILAGMDPDQNQFNIHFADSRMEGINAVRSVVNAFDMLENHPTLKFDCIVLARGGGSEQSLAVFNEYEICKRVCISKIPVITAIGHEKDISAVELCSHTTPTPATPSGVGKFLSNGLKRVREEFGELTGRILYGLSGRYRNETGHLKGLLAHLPVIVKKALQSSRERLSFKVNKIEDHVIFAINRAVSDVDHLRDTVLNRGKNFVKNEHALLRRSVLRVDFSGRGRELSGRKEKVFGIFKTVLSTGSRVLTGEKNRVEMYRDYAQASDPQKILERGFSLALDEDEKPLTTLKAFRKSISKKLRFSDGETFIEEREE